MDRLEQVQKLLEGICPECDSRLTSHKMSCRYVYRETWWNGKQLDLNFKSQDDEYWDFEEEFINSELDKR